MTRLRRTLLLGIAVSAVLLAVFIARLDWAEFSTAFRQVSGRWLVGAAAAVLGSVSVRALRWQFIAGLPLGRFVSVWYADVIGYVGNMLYPGRAGEVLRVAALHHIAQVRPGHALASAFADRLGDLVVLALAAVAVASTVMSLPVTVVVVAVAMAVVPLAAFVAFLAAGDRFTPLVHRVAGWLPCRLAERMPHWYAQSLQGADALRRPHVLAGALALSIVAVGCDYAIMWFAIRAMGWSLPFVAAVAVGVLIAFGTLLPAAPGYVGIYQIACVLALQPFDIAESAALAFSVIVQVTTLSVLALLGLAAFARYGWALHAPRPL